MHAAVRQIGIGVCLIVALVVTAYFCFQSWADGELAHSAQVMEIEPGASLGSIAQQLVELGVVSQPKLFKFLASVESLDTQLKAGEYALKTPISPRQLLEKFSSGEVLLHPVRLREGITALVMLQELKEIPHLQHTLGDFTSNNQVHAELAPKLGLSSASAEGYFFPIPTLSVGALKMLTCCDVPTKLCRVKLLRCGLCALLRRTHRGLVLPLRSSC